ncbi:MAG: histidine--tRNA ligase, partial [Desulfobacterales bacterium]|nr:histidine--tRNA ligase [Desulfobacterales bacterium]
MIHLIRGFKDILPSEVEIWQHIEKTAKSLFEDFGFREIRLPILERTELFSRSIGEDTDIVEKEMYTFSDRKGDLITLRPEATASAVRSYIQHKFYAVDPTQKFYTIGPMFRRERPQKGRYRQFYQVNAEVFGIDSPFIDAQLIYMLMILFSKLSVSDISPHINSLGCLACRPGFKESLMTYLSGKADYLCADCIRRKERNPLRVLDCKVPSCQEALEDAPATLDYLCDGCSTHFEKVKTLLEKLKVEFVVNNRLVRGLDYYTRTTFEIQTGTLGAQSAVAGGGRYDNLVKILGGPDTPAIGFAIGLDRLVEIIDLKNGVYEKRLNIFIAALGEISREMAFEWACALSDSGVSVEIDFSSR